MLKIVLAILAAVILFVPMPAEAHVLLQSKTGQAGAILHINPGDDPIAGEPSSLVFDVKDSSSKLNPGVYTLTISDSSGEAVTVPTTNQNGLIAAQYSFPSQGTYLITLSSPTLKFEYNQRIARGIANNPLKATQYPWADMLFTASGCAAIITIIIGYNRRHLIANHISRAK